MTAPGRPHVLIIGGGFGGLYAARRLKRADVAVTVLERGTSHVFQPLLYQCATGLLSQGSIASPLRHLLRHQDNAHVALGEATDVDAEAKEVTVSRFDGSTYELKYDYLVVATGMRQSYHGHDEYIQHAPGMKTLDDALTIRRKVIAAFEMAESLPTAEERKPWLTFAVAGGGPTGVELAGQIRELAMRALNDEFRSIHPGEARVLLLHSGDRVLSSFHEKLSARAQDTLDVVGVETHLGVHVTDVTGTDVETTMKAEPKTVTRYDTHTVLWTAGVEAVPFARNLAGALGVQQDRSGRIAVEPDLSVPGHRNVWVVGDTASLDDLPGVAEVAMQGGRHVGALIAHDVAQASSDNDIAQASSDNARPVEGDTARKPFKYHDLGTAAYIARGHALVQAGPLRMSGFLGWISWGVIHIAFLSGNRNRAGTLLNWAVTLATNSRRERAITYGDPETARKPYN